MSVLHNNASDVRAAIPRATCPIIDAAIERLEEIRGANETLRECAEQGADLLEVAEGEISDLEEEVKVLKADVDELEKEAERLRSELFDLRLEVTS